MDGMVWKARIADFEKKFAATHLATLPPPAPKLVRQDAHRGSESDLWSSDSCETDSWETDSEPTSDTELNTIQTLCKIVNDYVTTSEIYHIIFPLEDPITIVDKILL